MNDVTFLCKVAEVSGMKYVRLDGCTMTPLPKWYSSYLSAVPVGEGENPTLCFRSVPSPSRCPYQLASSHFSRPYEDVS